MLKKYRKIIIVTTSIFIVLLIITNLGLLNFESLNGEGSEGTHYNLITINSVLAGFMFTSLSLIVSVANSDTVRRLERTVHMDLMYNNIMCGIFSSLLSIVISLIMIFIIPNTIKLISTVNIINNIKESIVYFCTSIVPFLELYTLLVSIGCFLVSVLDVKFIIKSIRRKLLKNNSNKEDMQKTLDLIK